ncbi:hypothetical protein [Corynebacterium aurimucosum]
MTDSFACIANGTDERFTHQGINCMVQMGPFSINGYIELPDNHPWLDEAEDLQFFDGVDVHGGLTYHKGRVIGFDTNHAGDEPHPSSEFGYLTRGISTLSMFGEIPRSWTWEEVEAETRRLAE